MKQNGKNGFSLIEVLVATSILLIIVVMIGDIFNRSSSAWDSGYARAEGGMIVRGVLGTIQRELSSAVDGRLFGMSDPIQVSGSSVSFFCFKTSEKNERELHKVEFRWTGSEMKRSDTRYKNSGGSWTPDGGATDSVLYSEESDTANKTYYSAVFKFEKASMNDRESDYDLNDNGDQIVWNIPYLTVTVELTRTGHFTGVEAISLGPNGKWDGEGGEGDDIISR